MLIGVAERKNWIFVYRPLDVSYFASSVPLVDTSSLWHKRFGHPSNFVVEKFLGQSFKHETNKSCSIYLRAK